MKNLELTILKKNRVYFACKNEKGYPVKLKITEKSKWLELGKHNLLVNDISIISKYGTDYIYELEEKIVDKQICILKHRYNSILVDECRKLGGKWDKVHLCWVFPAIVSDKVEDLEFLYNASMVQIEVKIKKDDYGFRGAFEFLGYPLAKGTGRDSGAVVCKDVSMIQGKIDSGGSSKNWTTEVSANSIFRLTISKNLLESITIDLDLFEVKTI